MKKLILISTTLLAFACAKNRNLSDLKMNVDKPADVEAKFGKPDSIARHSVLGMTAEFWAYKNDSICLLFENDILTTARDHCYGRFVPTTEEKSEMEANAKRLADSIAESLNLELERAMNEASKPAK